MNDVKSMSYGKTDAGLAGIVAASLTPLTSDGTIDTVRMQHHFEWLFASGCSYVSPFGSTGEGPSFSVAEKSAALTRLSRAGVDMARIIPAAMSASVADCVASIETALGLGCRAILIVPPYYYGSVPQQGIADFFAASARRFGGQFPIDVILYHIPAMSRIGFGTELIDQLVSSYGERIVGIKDSTGDRDHSVMLARRYPELRIFTGDDRVLPDLLDAGGAGMIGGLPNIVAPDLCAFYADPKGKGADDIIGRATARICAIDAYGGIGALRAIKAECYKDPAWAVPMPPLRALETERYRELRAVFADTGFAF